MSRHHNGRASGKTRTHARRIKPTAASGNRGVNERRRLEEQAAAAAAAHGGVDLRALYESMKLQASPSFGTILTCHQRGGTLSTDSVDGVSMVAAAWLASRLVRALDDGEPCRQAYVKIEVFMNPGDDVTADELSAFGDVVS